MDWTAITRSPSKKLTVLLGFFCFGVLVGPLFLSWPTLPFLLLTVALVIISMFFIARHQLVFLLVAVCLFGIFRYQQSFFPGDLPTIVDYVDTATRIEGSVLVDVERRIGFQQAILSDVRVADHSVFGKLLVRFPLSPRLVFNDRVMFSCTPERPEPFNGFAYDRELASRGVLATCSFPQFTTVVAHGQGGLVGFLLSFRDALITRLRAVVPEPHASFLAGLLFGGSSSLSKDLREDFSRTGTSHILAASGFNVSIFSVLLLRWLLQSPLGRRRGLMATALLLLGYVLMAGATPAVLRAGLMAGMLIVASGVRRRVHTLNVVLLALSIMLLANPRLLLDDVGFQLSFVATCALLFVLPIVEKRFRIFPEALGIRTAIASSTVAIIFTLPILLWHFGEISLIAPLVNALVLPFVPYLMALAVIGMVGGAMIALPAYALSYLVLRVLTVFASLPFSSVTVDFSKTLAVILAGAIIAWLIHKKYAPR